jgi:tellurite resistance protein TehA-like permease
MFLDSNAPKPIRVDTDPSSAVALKYKKKTDEWTKDDRHFVRNMQVTYFSMPVAIAGLAVAFKMASDWGEGFKSGMRSRHIVPELWYQVISIIAAVVFALFAVLYMTRVVAYPRKIAKEWDSPLSSNGFGLITICLMLFSFLIYDEIDYSDDEEPTQFVGRYVWWIGAVGHALLTVIKFGEWIGRRLEMEHLHPQWMILPVGLGVAALVAPLVKPFPDDNDNSVGNVYLARFFYSFAWLMWLTLFILTFFKVVTTHNSDNRIRHGVFIWLAAPCVLAMAEYAMCSSEGFLNAAQCEMNFSEKYFIGIFIFCGLFFATLPHIGFFGRDSFNMGYWTECFALDTLAACACLFYTLTGWQTSRALAFTGLTMAAIANMTALLHFGTAVVRRREIFTPEVKWGPLSFMKLTHEAFRGNMATLRHYIDAADVTDASAQGRENLDLFAAHFNRFVIMHEEHAKHEDKVIFKVFNDFFPEHARKYNDDHAEDHRKLEEWRVLANKMLDKALPTKERQKALDDLRAELPSFFEHFEEHLRGEEDNLNPIGRKILNLKIMKDISRKVWEITPATKWEIIIPFVVVSLPRHLQRVRYLKVLCWSMPERAQQIGAIVYRNVDAVMWERLRVEVPEIIPRGVSGWKRYY